MPCFMLRFTSLHAYMFRSTCFMLYAMLSMLRSIFPMCCLSNAYEALFGCNHLGCITMRPVASCIPFPFSTSCDDMLTMLVCATCWFSMHLYTFAYMFMHESCLLVCHPYFKTMELWTFNSYLHLSIANTTFCLLSCLFAFLLVCLLSCFFARHVYHVSLLLMTSAGSFSWSQ